MTPEELDQIEARVKAATPGPWHRPHDPDEVCVAIGDYGWVTHGENSPEYDADSEQGQADAEFIAHTRQDIPELLAEIQRLRRAGYRAAGEIERAGGPSSIKHARLVREFIYGDEAGT